MGARRGLAAEAKLKLILNAVDEDASLPRQIAQCVNIQGRFSFNLLTGILCDILIEQFVIPTSLDVCAYLQFQQ